MQQRIQAVAAVSTAVVVFGAAAYVIAHRDHVAHAGQTPGYSLTTAGSAPTTAVSTTSASHVPVIAFLGDDYTSGKGAGAKSKRFSTLIAHDLNVSEKNSGHDGAGYAMAGGKSYDDAIAAVVNTRPDVVVVTGGRNDVVDVVDRGTLSAAVTKLFKTLHEKLPGSRLIAVAPFWGDSDPPGQLAALGQMVKTAVTSAGGTYVDLADPLHGHSDYMADDADPNNAGYQAIARALEPKLRPFVTGG